MNARTILAIGNYNIGRAECGPDGEWRVETVLADVDPRTLAADPHDSDVLYAGTQGNGIHRSVDRGRNWQPIGMEGQVVKSIAVSPHDSNIIYAGTRPAEMYVSHDRGWKWEELTGFRDIPNRWWWFSPAESPWKAYVMQIAVSPQDPDVVLAGIEFGAVIRSEDGGRTWSSHRSGALRDCHALKFHAHDGNWAYQAGGTGGGASVSRDGGQNWHKMKAGLVKNYGVSCAADPERPEVWYVSVAPGPGKAYGEEAEAYLYRASAGADWQPIGWKPHPMADMPTALVTMSHTPGHLYAGTRNGKVWHTADYGDTWHKLPFNLGHVWHSMLVL